MQFAAMGGSITMTNAGQTQVQLPVGAVAVGQSETLTVEATALMAGTLTDQAGVTYLNGSATQTTLASVNTTVAIPTNPGLSLNLNGSPQAILTGQVVTYTLIATNNGTAATSSASLFNILPAGLAITSGSASAIRAMGGSIAMISEGQTQVELPVGAVAIGQAETLTVEATALASGTFTDQVGVTFLDGSTSKTTLASVNTQVTSPIVTNPSFAVALDGSPSPLFAGQVVTYTLTATNHGTAATSSATLELLLPSIVEITPDSSAAIIAMGGTVTTTISNETQVDLPVGAVAIGGTKTLIIQATAVVAGSMSVDGKIIYLNGSATESASATIAAQVAYSFVVINNNDGGFGSLRQALLNGNQFGAPVTISFDLPADQLIIQPPSALPIITAPVTIDATTQPDFAGSPIVQLDGSKAPTATNGLIIAPGGVTVRGLNVENFGGDGIFLMNGGDNRVVGDLLQNNGDSGLYLQGSLGNTIGGADPADRDVLSGNEFVGLQLTGGSAFNLVQGNFIGLGNSGISADGNGLDGILISNSSDNSIVGNAIAANGEVEIQLYQSGATRNLVAGNVIGLDATGSAGFFSAAVASRGESNVGIFLNDSPGNTIGGYTARPGT